MSYLVLARKWRPQGFDELIGQEMIIRVLKNAIDQKRIAHAYLFSGPRGVGKTSTARILAKALNCSEGPTSHPCGRCTFCTSITDGSSVDVMEIDGASNNSVNDIRDLRERVKYVPSGGTFKVYIIDETHMLSDSAFNALLKTLEEPPPHVIFVLATTAPRKIPATVLSRCQHLMFRRISTARISGRLSEISASERIDISQKALETISRAADGSLRDALTILDQLASFSSSVTESDVQDLLGITDFTLLSTLAAALIEGNRNELVRLSGELVEKGTDIRSFMKELIQFFRNLMVLSVSDNTDGIVDLSEEEVSIMQQLRTKTTGDFLMLITSELLKAEIDIRNASLPRIVFEMYLLKISFLSDMQPIEEILQNLDTYVRDIRHNISAPSAERSVQREALKSVNGPSKPSQEKQAEHKDPGLQTFSLTSEIWENTLKSMPPPLASKLSKVSYGISGNILSLMLDEGHAVFADSLRKHASYLGNVFSERLGGDIEINIQTNRSRAPRKKELKEEVMSDPKIKEILELFDGRIVDINPIRNKKTPDTQ